MYEIIRPETLTRFANIYDFSFCGIFLITSTAKRTKQALIIFRENISDLNEFLKLKCIPWCCRHVLICYIAVNIRSPKYISRISYSSYHSFLFPCSNIINTIEIYVQRNSFLFFVEQYSMLNKQVFKLYRYRCLRQKWFEMGYRKEIKTKMPQMECSLITYTHMQTTEYPPLTNISQVFFSKTIAMP